MNPYQHKMLTTLTLDRTHTWSNDMMPTHAAYTCNPMHATNTLAAMSERLMRSRCLASVLRSRFDRHFKDGVGMACF
jgi:hypothetical protein